MADDEASDVTAPDARWLAKLPGHGIFVAPAPASSALGVGAARQHDGDDAPNCMAVRNADVLVSYGKELRMASLLEVKHQQADASRTSAAPSPPPSSSYKRLTARALDFPIERLLVNPTGKLLAVVGAHKVVVVVLPRTGTFLYNSGNKHHPALTSSGPVDVGVKAALVGAYYHHERIGGRARLAEVQWHPWGESGSSLLVMTRDGVLREFDVSLDVEEPVQTVSALSKQVPATKAIAAQSSRYRARSRRSRSRSKTPGTTSLARARRSTSRIAFDDDSASDDGNNDAYFSGEEHEDGVDDSFYTAAAGSIRSIGQGRSAVAFTLGIDVRSQRDDEDDDAPPYAPDWTPLTLFTLCTNGDLYALCPFMPKRASLPFSYLRSLASYVSLARPDSVRNSGDTGDLQVRFVSSLLKQASAQRQGLREGLSRAAQRRAMSATPMSIDANSRAGSVEPGNVSMNEDEDEDDELVTVQAPSTAVVPLQPQPQGPFLLAPAPHELSEERESRGADVFFARIVHADDGLNVIGIASDDGRIDMCVALAPIAAEWSAAPAPTKKKKRATAAAAKPGRYALSDSDSDDDDDNDDDESARAEPAEQLPTLIVYESIDLGILHAIGDDVDGMEHALRSTPVRFVLDPLYADLVYVCHIAGAHAIGFGGWARRLTEVMQDRTGDGGGGHVSALQRLLHHGTPSDVACVVNSVPQGGNGLSSGAWLNPIRDVCIVSDVYLCYSFIALAQSGSVVALELNLRVDEVQQQQQQQGRSYDSDLTQKGLSTMTHDVGAAIKEAATSGPVPPAYASLLGDGPPFAPPEPFKSFQGLPTKARSAVPRSGGGGGGELVVSPETLRTLATTVQTLRGQMRDIVLGGNTVQKRLELQMEELKRQLSKLDQVSKRVQERQRQSDGATSLASRVQRVVETQQTIVRRSDRLLQRLIESHSPELSVYEKRWLEELNRLQTELGGGGGGAGASADGLAARVEALRHRLDILRPDMEAAAAAAAAASATNGTTATGLLGRQQLQQIEKLLEAEGKLLTLDQHKIHQLNAQVQRQLRAAASAQSRARSAVDL